MKSRQPAQSVMATSISPVPRLTTKEEAKPVQGYWNTCVHDAGPMILCTVLSFLDLSPF